MLKRILIFISVCTATPIFAADLTIHLPAGASVSSKSVQFACDANGAKLGLPTGQFTVDYINGGGNSLAVVPISGHSLIFASVVSGSGARYAAQQYTWWEAKGSVTVSSLSGNVQSTCRPAAR